MASTAGSPSRAEGHSRHLCPRYRTRYAVPASARCQQGAEQQATVVVPHTYAAIFSTWVCVMIVVV